AVVGVARSLRLVAGYERYVANGDRRRGRRAPLPCRLETRRIDRAQAAGGLAPRQPAAEKPAKGAANGTGNDNRHERVLPGRTAHDLRALPVISFGLRSASATLLKVGLPTPVKIACQTGGPPGKALGQALILQPLVEGQERLLV